LKNFLRFLAIFLTVVAIDVLTKIWAEQTLELHQPVPVIGDLLRFTLAYNSGVAFGMFGNSGPLLLIVTGLVILGLAIWALVALRDSGFASSVAWPMGIILGGAVANFIDRLPDQRVTDFLDVGIGATRWPTFNLADSFIFIGMAILLLATFIPSKSNQPAKLEA